MKNSLKVTIGIVLIAIGALLLVERLGVFLPFSINVWEILGLFWPLFLVGLGLKLFFDGNAVGGAILFTLGCVIFLTNMFDFNFFSVLWPLLIVAMGVSVLVKRDVYNFNKGSMEFDEDYLKESVAFWGSEKRVTSKDFRGGDINIAFGGMELDLREAKVHKDGAKLNINVAFAGAEIFVPKDCRVKTNGTGILGGWDPQLKNNDVKEPVLEITGTAILGGVEIKD